MKKSLFCILIILLPMLASAETVEINGIWYNLISKGEIAEVTQNPIGASCYSGGIEIPPSVTYNKVEYSVTSIGNYAFYECGGLTSVIISNSVTSIGEYAFFHCSILTSVIIGNSVTSIGDGAFNKCSNLSFVTIGNSVTSIGQLAFAGCTSLTSVIIPNSVTSIGESAFSGCSGLSSTTIGNSVTSIGQLAFAGCTSLTSVIIPNSVTSIGSRAFYGCTNLTSVNIPNNLTSIEESTFLDCAGLTTVTIGNSVTSIGNHAFDGCSKLISVNIPNSVTSIGNLAFFLCTDLTSVHITDIESWCRIAFSDNPLINAHHLYLNGEEIKDLVIPSGVTSLDYTFFGCSGLTSVTIPNSVTSIGLNAFNGCTGLTSVTIPNSVTSIGESAFNGCTGLTSVIIPKNVSSIGGGAFYGCSGLTSVIIPNNVTSIGNGAFYGCSDLTSVIIGSGVTDIREYAFANCEGLTDVYCLAEKLRNEVGGGEGLYTHPNAFEDSYPKYMNLHVPVASAEAYGAIEPWKSFKVIVGLNGEDIPEIPVTPKCATPTISLVNGKITFSCETEGVEYISEVTVSDAKKYYNNEISAPKRFKVTVYATKASYENSDTATAEFDFSGETSLSGDVDGNGIVNVADHVKLSDIIMHQE